ncbi:MAG: hypothetical protein QME62_13155 [Armatimonadota bacterium]|nr:hypothetical protein [Armatimonadota bacterium]
MRKSDGTAPAAIKSVKHLYVVGGAAMYPCESWLIEHDKCPVCQNKLIHAGGCTECITGDWSKCG